MKPFWIRIWLLGLFLSMQGIAATRTWTGGGSDNNWTTPANWGGVAPVSGDVLVFSGNTRLSAVNDFAEGTTFNGIQFSAGAGAFVLTGNGIALSGGASALLNQATTNTQTIQLNLAFSGSAPTLQSQTNASLLLKGTLGPGALNLSFAGGGSIAISGVLSGSGQISVGMTGSGSVLLSGVNTFTGPMTIVSGTLLTGSNSALGNSSGITITTGAVLDLYGVDSTKVAVPLTLSGTGISNGGALVNSGATRSVYSGVITLGSSARITAQGAPLILSNTAAINGAGYSLSIGGSKDGELWGGLNTGNGGLIKDGSGTWIINGTNTYSGATNVAAGRLQLGKQDQLNHNTNLIIDGELDIREYNLTVGSLSGSGLLSKLTGAGTYTVTVGGNNTSTTFSGEIQNLTGALALTKEGMGKLILSGTNHYKGPTIINGGGSIQAGSANAISDSSSFTVNGTLDLNGFSTTIASLSGAGIVDNSAGGDPQLLSIGRDNSSTTFPGTLKNTGSKILLEKVGLGTLTLTGHNTFSGGVEVKNGTLNVTGIFDPGDEIVIKSDGTLAGTGQISRNVTIESGGNLNPGGSGTGTITMINLTLGEAANINLNLGTSSDFIQVNGDLIWNGVVNITAEAGFTYGEYNALQYQGTGQDLTSRFGVLPTGAYGFSTTDNSKRRVITVEHLLLRSLIPADNDVSVSTSLSELVIIFNQNVFAGAGSLSLKKKSDQSIVQTTAMNSSTVLQAKDSLLANFETEVQVNASSTNLSYAQSSIQAHSGTKSLKVVTTNSWAWLGTDQTNDFSAYDTLIAWVYTDEASTCARIYTQSENWNWRGGTCMSLTAGQWNRIYYLVSGCENPKVIQRYGVQFSTSGTYYMDDFSMVSAANRVRIPLTTKLLRSTEYYVNVQSNAIRDANNNYWAGIPDPDQTTWSFTTGNTAPSGILLAGDSIGENQPIGTVVGTLSTEDIDSLDTHTYALVAGLGDDDNATFKIVGNALQVLGNLNFESDSNLVIRVKTTDAGGASFEKSFTIRVLDENDPPSIVSNGGGATANLQVSESVTAVTTVVATDPDKQSVAIYRINGGADADLFKVDSISGVLWLAQKVDYENPTDANLDGIYIVEVLVDDTLGGVDSQTLSITIVDGNDSPIITYQGGGTTSMDTVVENSTSVGQITASDQDGDPIVFGITGGKDANRFSINQNSGWLSFKTAPNFESPLDANLDNQYEVKVRASDGTSFGEQTIFITVINENEAVLPLDSMQIILLNIDNGVLWRQKNAASDTIVVPEGMEIRILMPFSDPEGKPFQLQVQDSGLGASYSVAGDTALRLTWQVLNQDLYTFYAESEDAEGLIEVVPLFISVVANQAPEFRFVNVVSKSLQGEELKSERMSGNSGIVAADAMYNMRFFFEDPEHDPYHVRIVDAPNTLQWLDEDGVLLVSGITPSKGQIVLQVEVYDNGNRMRTYEFTFTVRPIWTYPIDTYSGKNLMRAFKLNDFDVLGRQK